MVLACVVGLVVVAVASLVAWRWWLEFRRWDAGRADKARDEAVATQGLRLQQLEDRVKALEYGRPSR